MIKRIFLTLLISTLFLLGKVEAQRDYATAIGARVSPSSGLTVKTFINDKSAFEGILSTRWRGVLITGLYELHQNAFQSTNFNFYYGIGAHVGWWNTDKYKHPWWDDKTDHTVFGIDGIIGLEYTFDEIPFNLSLDWKPMMTFVDYSGFTADEVGFSVRYTIK